MQRPYCHPGVGEIYPIYYCFDVVADYRQNVFASILREGNRVPFFLRTNL